MSVFALKLQFQTEIFCYQFHPIDRVCVHARARFNCSNNNNSNNYGDTEQKASNSSVELKEYKQTNLLRKCFTMFGTDALLVQFRFIIFHLTSLFLLSHMKTNKFYFFFSATVLPSVRWSFYYFFFLKTKTMLLLS